MLSVLDRKWREHLYEMDYLREGIGLRAYSQRDPLVEYQREGYELFTAMMEGIAEESVGFLFNVDVQVEAPDADGEVELSAKGLEENVPQQLSYSGPDDVAGGGGVDVEVRDEDDDDPLALSETERVRQVNAKNRARQKAKAQRKSRKKNR